MFSILGKNARDIIFAGKRVSGLAGSIVLKRLDGRLDAFIVKVGIVLFLEGAEYGIELVEFDAQLVALIGNLGQGLAQLIDTALGLANEDTQLPAAGTRLDDPIAVLLLEVLVLGIEDDLSGLSHANLGLELGDAGLCLDAEGARVGNHLGALGLGILHFGVLFLGEASVLLADFSTAVLALGAADRGILLAAVTAEIIVADAVVDVDEGHVGANVALVGAPEAGQGVLSVGGAGGAAGQGLLGG